jgi:hypothetical protein
VLPKHDTWSKICPKKINEIKFKKELHRYTFNGEASSANITLDGTMCPGQKLVCFVLPENNY